MIKGDNKESMSGGSPYSFYKILDPLMCAGELDPLSLIDFTYLNDTTRGEEEEENNWIYGVTV